jgi:DNA-binding NarL/FixJ family response regulator
LVAGVPPTSESVAAGTVAIVGLVAGDLGVRTRLVATLGAAGIEVAAEAPTGSSLLAALHDRVPGAVVVAPHGGTSATAEIRALRQRLRDVPIVALIAASDEGEGRRAISAGANGAVLDRDLDHALAATVVAAAAGQISFPQALEGAAAEPSLTQREKQVLASVVSGFTNAQIARHLGLAESTVKSHLSSAFAKLGVASRAEAAALIRDPVRGRGLDVLTTESD